MVHTSLYLFFHLLFSSHSKLATHYIPSNRIGDLCSSLSSDKHPLRTIETILNSFTEDLEPYSLKPVLPAIEACFGGKEISSINKALEEALKSPSNEAS